MLLCTVCCASLGWGYIPMFYCVCLPWITGCVFLWREGGFLQQLSLLMRRWTHLTCVSIVLDSLARPVFQGWGERFPELFYLLCPCVKINELIPAWPSRQSILSCVWGRIVCVGSWFSWLKCLVAAFCDWVWNVLNDFNPFHTLGVVICIIQTWGLKEHRLPLLWSPGDPKG